jgi:hypothetical protein
MIYRWQAPPSPPPTVTKLDGMAHRKTEKERQLGCGREGKRLGEEPNRTTARKLVLFKSINTLWKQTSREKTEMFRDRLHGTRR